MKKTLSQLFHKAIKFPFVYGLLQQYPYPKALIRTSTHNDISVLIAKNRFTRALGLSYRRSMEAFQGMLFCFDRESIHNFHMKGMCFPLDIVWLDSHYKVIYISYNVLPGRDSISIPFPNQYVLEIPAMQAGPWGFKLGSTISVQYQ